jgi:DNA-binding NarL/FixJ family response regulator
MLWMELKVALQGQPNYRVVRCEADSDPLALCRRLAPAILVIDAEDAKSLPEKHLRIFLRPGAAHVLVFADPDDARSAEALLRMGCSGVISRQSSPENLVKAVDSIFAGELWFPRRVISAMLRYTLLETSKQLTRREVEILRLLSSDIKNQQIADSLFISRETVRWHLRSIYTKIGVKNRDEAIRYARGSDQPSEMPD